LGKKRGGEEGGGTPVVPPAMGRSPFIQVKNCSHDYGGGKEKKGRGEKKGEDFPSMHLSFTPIPETKSHLLQHHIVG